ncbi:hypothetical protein NC661_18065 [Aquibacillus koreensis]|uniref:Uncharacterized protein n=1 Tax=Aquibacillus koreensis TaxID=279446 RepID=A0A9X4AJW9_9BACI|nr:hypothetical protein [Aquibacillus koreensis]MCT2535424.1 hypothetical protein [Aquibacillus koreensis]MDC3422259.1 hypothetical protein [Aquibacillus koreensis]
MELIIFLVIIIGIVYGWRDYKKKAKAAENEEVRNTFVPLFLLALLVVLIVYVFIFS